MMEVSAGIVRRTDGAVLICKRGEGRKNAHLWEFPGGKRENGESAADCLRRELMEELNLPVTAVETLCVREEGDIRFTFLTAFTEARPVRTEHEDLAFVSPRALLDYRFCPADEVVARQLALRGVRNLLWDFDGTLVDTYPALTRGFLRAAAEMGVNMAPDQALTLLKHRLNTACEAAAEMAGVSAETLLALVKRRDEEELQSGADPVPGIPETLRQLKAAGYRHFVVTHRGASCYPLLRHCGILDCFEGFVTGEQGLPRKPAPDMLLHLMAEQNLPPETCLMIGDRPLDVEAGQAAGTFTCLLDVDHRFPQCPANVTISCPTALSALLLTNW